MNKFLYDEKPLVIQPSLAKLIGLNESIILQQLHYWLEKSENVKDGYRWVYNTYQDWNEQFPFWSQRTIRRIITGLENKELIITGNYNKLKIDNTKWYRMNYEKFNQLVATPSGQIDQTERTSWTDGQSNLSRPLPEITSEITTDINKKDLSPKSKIYDEDSPFIKLAKYMLSKIKEWKADFVFRGNIQTWADEFRKMYELDKRSKEDICNVIVWAINDSFWQSNILSPSTLRKQFDRLQAQMNNDKRALGGGSSASYSKQHGNYSRQSGTQAQGIGNKQKTAADAIREQRARQKL